MVINWNPPWPYPVDSYNLLIENGKYSNEIDTTMPSIVFSKNGSFSECTLFSFRVQVNTDVGSSAFSNATLAGFPTGDAGTYNCQSNNSTIT